MGRFFEKDDKAMLPMPRGGHTAVLVVVAGVPRLQAAAARRRRAAYGVQVAAEREGACPPLASWGAARMTGAAGT